MTKTSFFPSFVVFICTLGATLAPAQMVCEWIPRFTATTLVTSSCWPVSEVSGRVLGVDLSKGAVQVSLSALALNKFFDVVVDASGGFNVSSVPAGDYGLLVMQRGRILGFGVVIVAPVTSQLIFQLSNHVRPLGPGPLRSTLLSEEISAAQFSMGSLDWPPLEGPHCIRSKCYVHSTDDLNQ